MIVQGRPSGSRRYSTFADATTSRTGTFRVRYRFRDRGSRGRRFVFRARIRPKESFPYETGYSRTVTVQRSLRSRLPSVYGHGGRER